MSASPLCEIKNGAAAYAATTSGVDITPSATIIIRLASTVDVSTWLIECATTDDTSDAATVTASLTIDSALRTATFTAPAAGKAYRFRSRVNNGLDVNNVADTALETTFCVYTLTNSRRVMAADETTEGDATFGWIKWLNDLIRNPTAGSSTTTPPGGASGQVQFHDGASFAGASGMRYAPSTFALTVASLIAHQATLASVMIVNGTGATGMHLVAPVLHAPILAATTVFTGTDICARGLSDHQPISAVRSLLLTGTGVTNLYAWRVRDEAVTSAFVEVNAVPSGGNGGGVYGRRVLIRADGGAATAGGTGMVESTWSEENTTSVFTGMSVGSGIWIGVSGMTGFVNIKSSAQQVKVGVTVTRTETSWA